jgi:hypothetical protein
MGFRSPAPGRALYLLRGGRLVFAGHEHGHCEGCGALLAPDDGGPVNECPLCGCSQREAVDDGGGHFPAEWT